MKARSCRFTLTIMNLVLVGACSQNKESAPAAEVSVPPAEPAVQMQVRTRAPEDARVFFISPRDGDILPETFKVEFGIEGMTVVRAGEQTPNAGHHHLLIDTDLPDLNYPVPADANHVHFGDASTTTERTLPPGEHTLQLLFADHLHIPHDPPVYSERITITVE
ncbi:MAG: DUF4399 domain-containing protein [Gammaproteobacteria bacterium]|nr:DUF4399 domain-containing protein [Gammaproteobacteria bacterium]